MTVHCPTCNDVLLTRESLDLYCFKCQRFYQPSDCDQYEILTDDEQTRVTLSIFAEAHNGQNEN